jgi:hypothetical protein
MMATANETFNPVRAATISSVNEWRLPHYLALMGIVFIVYQTIGWVGWLADGPVQLVKYRDTHSQSWQVCRILETITVLVTLIMGYVVIRRCVRERTITFDALFCIACTSLYWQDPMANLFQPLFLWSENFTNLNDWMGYLPFNPNPDAGRTPEPILNDGLNYVSAWLMFSMFINWAMRSWKQRFPGAKKVHLFGLAFVLGALCDIALEWPYYKYEVWEFPGSPDFGIWGGTSHKFPFFEFISGAIMFSLVASVRYFRDDRGQSIVERNLDGYSPGVKKLIALGAMIGLFNIGYLADNSIYWFLGTFSAPYKYMPAHIVGGSCDAPGWSGTRYGPCPGSPGYRMPLIGTHSLQGDMANSDPKWLNGPKQCPTCELTMFDYVPIVDGVPRPDLKTRPIPK